MSFVPSLLQAIVRLDGEAVVLHTGERPYVVTPTGQVDLATRGLTIEALTGVLGQLLPIESRNALDEFGAAQYELPADATLPGERFTIVVARGGDNVWLEIRRRRVRDEEALPPELFSSQAVIPPPSRPSMPPPAAPPDPVAGPRAAVAVASAPPPPPSSPPQPEEEGSDEGRHDAATLPAMPASAPPPPAAPMSAVPPPAPMRAERLAAPTAQRFPAPIRPIASAPPPALVPPITPPPPQISSPAPVLSLSRSPIRPESPPRLEEQTIAGLDRLLRQAAARGASILYLASGSRPAMRLDGDVQTLDGAPVLGPNDVESLLLTLMPDRSAEALRSGTASEWICDVADLGRVRCMSFRDSRGPGGVFRLMPTRAISAEQLGLSREIQSLANEPEGLVLVAGPRSSGKRTLISAFVDLINRGGRRDHIITIESEISVSHERVGSFISQREVRGDTDAMLAAARAALREDPDVLVLEEIRTPGLVNVALDAAASGQLVIGAFPAHSASGAVDRIIDLYPPESRRQIQLSLAQNLRGVVAQVLLRKHGGGRVAAREVLLNTPAVRSVLAEGRTSQLPLTIEGGRVHGMIPLNDALVGYVKSGIVDVGEAYRCAVDRSEFLALLKRQGVDISAVDRYA